MREKIQGWADRLEAYIARRGVACVQRVAVVAETGSTQDAAWAMSGGAPGLLVLAGRQTAGRGRLGRSWTDTGGAGLAATFVLPAGGDAGVLSLAAGVAAGWAVEEAVRRPAGLRWPNDVVERERGRKVAGVLVERRDGAALVGVGINVRQKDEDWPAELRSAACSLRQLGSAWSRIDAAEALMGAMDRALRLPAEEVADQWARRDVLIGTRGVFECDGARVEGIVEAIRPEAFILVRTADGSAARLPAMTTSLVKQ